MNKSELIEAIAQEAGISKAAAQKALDATTNAVTNALKKGETVTLVGFGTFSALRVPAGRAPRHHASRAALLCKARARLPQCHS